MEDETVEKVPDLELPQLRFLLTCSDDVAPNKHEIKQKLLEAVKANNMVPFYLSLCEQFKWEVDTALLESMKAANAQKLKELDDKIEDATNNLGEGEVREALYAKAKFYASIGDKENAISAYRLTEEQSVPLGQRLDITFAMIRLGFFFNDSDLIHRNIKKGKGQVEEGGDWDRRNRLKVYEALFHVMQRNFKRAAEQFLEALATFTSYELFSYKDFVFLTVLLSVVALDRVTLRSKVVNAPEILAVIKEVPHLQDFLDSIYNANYQLYFVSLAGLLYAVKGNRYLAPHSKYFCREARIVAYTQLLASYRTVQIESMAKAFGVTTDFLDRELSRFIASGRLHCRIDKVGGIVESNRPDSKNAQYQVVLKQGDLLLNRIQKLGRVITV